MSTTPNLPPLPEPEYVIGGLGYWKNDMREYALAALPLALKEEAETDSFHLTARAGKPSIEGGTLLPCPFCGGAAGQVAQALGRQFIGIELNTEYKALQDLRLCQPSLDLEAA